MQRRYHLPELPIMSNNNKNVLQKDNPKERS